MLDTNSNVRHDYGQKPVREDAECCTRELPIGHSGGWFELRRHDQLLHVAPSEV